MKNLKWIKTNISQEYNNYPLLKYLKILQPQWTKVFSIKMIRTKNVLINNYKPKINYKLKINDLLEINGIERINKNEINFSRLKPLKVIFEDKNLIIVDKERGISVQPDKKNVFNNMNNRLLNHLKYNLENQKDKWKPCFIHRLDYNTTGLLIGAKTYTTYTKLTKAMKNQEINKYYRALAYGLVKFKNTKIDNYLYKKNNKVYNSDIPKAGYRQAISEIKLIKHLHNEKNSLLEIKLITGRTHQIRAHLSHINHPIRGDSKYWRESDKKKYPYINLIAFKITFSPQIQDKELENIKGKTFQISEDEISRRLGQEII